MERAWHDLENPEEVLSPGLLISAEGVAQNIAKMLRQVQGPEWLRPHVKTHKMPAVVQLCLEAGIRKFKCATLAEAEMLGQSGAPDVLLAYQPVGPNIGHLQSLRERFPGTKFSTLVDNFESAQALSNASLRNPIPVWVDLDCGMHRSGIPMAEAGPLMHQLKACAGIQVIGLHAYDGHLHSTDLTERRRLHADAFASIYRLAREKGLPLVAGGTPTFPFHAQHGSTECSPGTPVFWDFGYAEKFPDLDYDIAAVLLTRVVSKPRADQVCLDLGYKAVASESPQPRVRFPRLPDATMILQSEEHLVVASAVASNLQVGQSLIALPRHICPTCALYDEASVVSGGRVVDRWAITARKRGISL